MLRQISEYCYKLPCIGAPGISLRSLCSGGSSGISTELVAHLFGQPLSSSTLCPAATMVANALYDPETSKGAKLTDDDLAVLPSSVELTDSTPMYRPTLIQTSLLIY